MKSIKYFLCFIIISLFIMPNVYASSLKVNEITVKDKSGTISIEDLELDDDGTITSNITFNQIHDFVTFDVEIENGENTPYAIESITNNNNDYLTVEYEYGKIIQPGTKEHFNVTLKYSEELINHDDITYNNLSLRLNFSNDQALINPQTSNPIQLFIKVLFLLGLLFVGTNILKKKHIKLFILLLLLIPFLTKAEEGKTISLNFNNVKVKARLLEYEIVIDLGNGEYQTVNETYGTTIEELPEPEKRGYSFTKWVDQDNEEVSTDTIITGDMQLTPVYEPIQYTITYNLAGGTVTNTNPVTYNIETDSFTLNNPTKPGYTFSGWRDEESGEVQTSVTVYRGTINDKSYTATFSVNTNTPYTVIHKQQNLNNNDYTTYETQNLTGATDSQVTPQRRSYTGFTAPSGQTVTINGNGTTTVTYLYTRNTYTFSVSDRTYVTGTSNGTYKYGTSISVTAQSRAGYTFKWSDNTTSYTKSFTISSNTTLSAVYTARTDTAYTVIHQQQNIDNNNYTTVATYTYYGTTGASITPSVNSYTGFTAPSTQTKTIAGDGSTTFTYQYTRNSYTLTLTDSEYITTTTPSGSYRYGKSITLTAKTREGYTFIKWSDNTTGSTYTFTMTGNKTIGPVYEQNKVTITFNANGGTVSPASREIVQGAQIGELPTPERTDYEFRGWYTAIENGTRVTSTTTFSSSVSIYALWDEENLLYNVLKNEAIDGGSARKYTGEHQDSMDETKCTKDIYHWYAANDTEGNAIANKNNVIFANQCWQMVRTTDTGGVRLLYNGEVVDNKCMNNRGYHRGFSGYYQYYSANGYWYSTGYTYDSSTGYYQLTSDKELKVWSSETASSLVGKYTCFSSYENTNCSSIYYISGIKDNEHAYVIYNSSSISPYAISVIKFENSDILSIGYKSSHKYNVNTKYVDNTEKVYYDKELSTDYWYADSVAWNSETNQYEAVNTFKVSSTSDYSNLVGKYTIYNANYAVGSNYVYIILEVDGSSSKSAQFLNGETPFSYNINTPIYTYGTSYTDNGDGTFTIESPTTITPAQWVSNYTTLRYKYFCKNAVNNTCSDLRYTQFLDESTVIKFVKIYKFGNSFTYSNGQYHLADTVFNSEYNKNHHYTCYNYSGICDKLYYNYVSSTINSDRVLYSILLENNESVSDAINTILNSNEDDSIAKVATERWYKDILYDEYDSYIEDTIYCSNRYLEDYYGFNPNATTVVSGLTFDYNSTDLSCKKTTDQFSVSNQDAPLNYKIGLPSSAEMLLFNNINVINKTNYFWTSSPYNVGTNIQMSMVSGNHLYYEPVQYDIDLRPEISLIPGIKYSSGDGSMENPYVLNYNIPICKRATSLHTTTCENSNMGCKYSIGTGNTITYGNLGTTGTLASGDAFDCDVNKDGTYDEATERFYYITSDGENSTLIYYTNVDGTTPVGNGTTGQASGNVAYHNQNYNYLGPVTAYVKLPTTSDWSNPLIIPPEENRQIKNEAGTTTNSFNGNNYPIQPFTYTNRAARLLTYQELKAACGNSLTSSGNLDNCNFLFENVERYERNGYNGALGHWLETPRSDGGNSSMFYINAGGRFVDRDGAENTHSGVRPVITVKTTNIEY